MKDRIKKNTLSAALTGMFFALIPVSLYYFMKIFGRVVTADTAMLIYGAVLSCTIPMVIFLSILFVNIIVQSIALLKDNKQKIRNCLSILLSAAGIVLLMIEIYKYFSILSDKLNELLRLG